MTQCPSFKNEEQPENVPTRTAMMRSGFCPQVNIVNNIVGRKDGVNVSISTTIRQNERVCKRIVNGKYYTPSNE